VHSNTLPPASAPFYFLPSIKTLHLHRHITTIIFPQQIVIAITIASAHHAQTSKPPGGRLINPHDRKTDNTTPTVAGPGILTEQATAIFITTARGLSKKVRNKYRSHICCFIKFLYEQYPMTYKECTVLMSEELHAGPMNYYTEEDIRDLVFSNLNLQYILAFF
jgi:hypothetical protein